MKNTSQKEPLFCLQTNLDSIQHHEKVDALKTLEKVESKGKEARLQGKIEKLVNHGFQNN